MADADLKEEIAASKAALAELAKKRKDADAKLADAKEARALKLALENNTAIMQAECEHGEQGIGIACIATPDGRMTILKRAPYALFRAHQEKKLTKTSDTEDLVSACRVYPDADNFDKIQEEYPGMLTVWTMAILKLAGALQEDAAKK